MTFILVLFLTRVADLYVAVCRCKDVFKEAAKAAGMHR